MAMYRIGVTESGDAAIDLSWVQKMGTVDGAVVITKQITHGFLDAVLDHQKKLIVHATLTGYGGSVLEPCVPTPDEQFEAVQALVDSGFPQEKIVIRVDPLIPTEKGQMCIRDRWMGWSPVPSFTTFCRVSWNTPICSRSRRAWL